MGKHAAHVGKYGGKQRGRPADSVELKVGVSNLGQSDSFGLQACTMLNPA